MGSRGYSSELNRMDGWRSVTVTYKREDDNLITTKVGYGDDYQEALRDADEQLRPGAWTRLAISQPSSVLTDMRNAGKARGNLVAKRPGEGETVIQLPPQARSYAGAEFSDE